MDMQWEEFEIFPYLHLEELGFPNILHFRENMHNIL